MSNKFFIGWLVIIMIISATVAFLYENKPKGRYYDCSISEISPDFPVEVKEECRKLRSEAYKNGRI